MNTLDIEIGRLPPPQSSPNWHPMTVGADWVRLRAIRQFKAEVRLYAIDARNLWEKVQGRKWVAPDEATIKPIFYKKRGRPQDDDNTIASLKSLTDVLCEEYIGILKDDSAEKLTWEKPEWHKGKENRLVIEIREEKGY